MKKLIGIFGILILLFTALTGCSKAEQLKLCRIEIADKNQNVLTILENQSQSDINELFNEDSWTAIEKPNDKLASEYVISVYQEKTKTVIETDSDNEYIKIMEYVTFENSEIVKVSIGKDLINGPASDKLLDECLEDYYIASSDFFSKIHNLVSEKTI